MGFIKPNIKHSHCRDFLMQLIVLIYIFNPRETKIGMSIVSHVNSFRFLLLQ